MNPKARLCPQATLIEKLILIFIKHNDVQSCETLFKAAKRGIKQQIAFKYNVSTCVEAFNYDEYAKTVVSAIKTNIPV